MSDPSPSAHEVTHLLEGISGGDPTAMERLVPLVYAELRDIAARQMRRERGEHTLQPTALVHEAFLRLVGKTDLSWQSRAHFLNIAAQAMRRILLMHARARRAGKRGGGVDRVTLDEELAPAPDAGIDLAALDEALERLSALYPRKARVVELRFFAGLSIDEAARVLDVSSVTVKREWQFAKAWIRRELADQEA